MSFKERYKENKPFFLFLLIGFIISLIMSISLLSIDYYKTQVPQSDNYKEIIKENIKPAPVVVDTSHNESINYLNVFDVTLGLDKSTKLLIGIFIIITTTAFLSLINKRIGILNLGISSWIMYSFGFVPLLIPLLTMPLAILIILIITSWIRRVDC